MFVYTLTRSRTELAVYWTTITADVTTLTISAVDCDQLRIMLQLSQNFVTFLEKAVLVVMNLREIIWPFDISVNSTQIK